MGAFIAVGTKPTTPGLNYKAVSYLAVPRGEWVPVLPKPHCRNCYCNQRLPVKLMHSFRYDVADDEVVVIHHNGDYSGEAHITHTFENRSIEIRVPVEALLEFAGEYVRQRKIGLLEQATALAILRGGQL